MKIYADILILENCIVDFFLLTLTMNCIKHKCKTSNLIISSFIGGIYTLVLILPKLNILASFPFQLAVVFIMVRLVYGKNSIFNLIKLAAIFLMISFTLSGICFLFSLKSYEFSIGTSYRVEKYSIKYIILSIMIIYASYSRITDYVKGKLFIKNFDFNVEFEIEKKHYSFKGFLDTGNELVESITNLPCILIEEDLIKDIEFNENNTYKIPYNSIGYGGDLRGIRINNIKITNTKHLYENVDAIICPCKQTLSREDEFNALLSRGIVYKEDVYGKTNFVL
ncbi:sigma-E processing peptidase SpoIIGA [Clostridium sp. C2-6-12]|uniref:sigma-E processing peptidase SpoIIGA n=1 Tax=Clostridium sp. C2-6-12 TaxID=2698832 RepID=UPI001367AE5B|nr:sigma-E processing peptidase SpoIIGA [Clostridium sp. C2-6-12]